MIHAWVLDKGRKKGDALKSGEGETAQRNSGTSLRCRVQLLNGVDLGTTPGMHFEGVDPRKSLELEIAELQAGEQVSKSSKLARSASRWP